MIIKTNKGVTLLELILVLGIMAILFSLSVPRIQATIKN
ncbi:MAG: Tfp pilus assembly protein FimT/FimU, partial [Clostridia bacterium]